MQHQSISNLNNKNIQNASSDEQYQNQISNQQSSKFTLVQNPQNQQVIDQKQQIRILSNTEINNQLETLEEIIKQQLVQDVLNNQLQFNLPSQKNITQSIVQNNQQTLQNNLIQQKDQNQLIQEPNLSKQTSSESSSSNRLSNIKIPIKTISNTSNSTSKYLQPNSPQLFITTQSLLPNQIICIQNNSTRVIVHMNKKIVPIPSSFNNDSKTRQSPQKVRVTLPSVQCPYLLGRLIVTNYKILYMDSLYPNTMTFCLPLNYILKIQRTNQQSTGISYIQIWFKTGLSIKLKYHQQEYGYSQKIKDIILTLIHKNLYAALDLGQKITQKAYLCKKYTQKYFDVESNRKIIKGIQAEIIDNDDWQQMTLYPQKYIVPLRYIGKRNTQTRLVVLSYVYNYQNQKISLWRTGPGLPDLSEQEWVPKAKFSNTHYIIQVKNKGIGIMKSQATKWIQIQNLYLLRQSFYKVHQLTYHNHESMKWLGNLCGTKWYQQVAALMNQALHIIQTMSNKVNVTLLCDTQGRGAQIAAIVQLLMNPFYRTFQGFPHLIQKQFLHYGNIKQVKKQRQQDKSIILIQFLDCVYQFTHLYPLSFEFSQYYLVYLAQHLLSNKYGNFLYITRQLKQQKDKKQVIQKCVCIWQDIKRKIQNDKKTFFEISQIKKQFNKKINKKSQISPPIHEIINYYIYFRNSFYIDHNESNIFELKNHTDVSKGIKLWNSYFSKKVYCTEILKQQILFTNQIEKRYFKIAYQHNLMKKYNENMRKKLSEQYSKIAEKKLILKRINEL